MAGVGMDVRQLTTSKEDGHHHLSTHDGVQLRAQQTMAKAGAKVKNFIASPMGKRKQTGAAAYGVPLGELMIQAGHGSHVPVIMEKLIDFITKNGLDEQGLFRVSGSARTVEKVRATFDKGGEIDLEPYLGEISAVAGALKLFLRELPDPLVPNYQHAMFIRGSKKCDSDDQLVEELKTLVGILPMSNRNVLKYLCSFLVAVADHEHNNKMNAKGLGIVFGPNIFRCTMEGMEGLQEQTCTNVIVEKFVSRYEDIFGESPSVSTYHNREPTSPMSPVNHVLRSKPITHASSPPHKPKPYRQYKADKQEAGGNSPCHPHTRHASESAVMDTGGCGSGFDDSDPPTPQRSMSYREGHGSSDGEYKDRKMSRWNSASNSPHHGPRISAARSPGPIRRDYMKSKERGESNLSDGIHLAVPNGPSSLGVDDDIRPDSPWSPVGSTTSTPVPPQAPSPNSNALIDDVIETALGEQLLGVAIRRRGDGDEESAIGSLGSGSIHHFSGEDLADIMAPGKRPEAVPRLAAQQHMGAVDFLRSRGDGAAGQNDAFSGDEDVVMGDHRPAPRATRAETTIAIHTTDPSGEPRHGSAAGGDDTAARHARSIRSGSVETTLSHGVDAQALRGVQGNTVFEGSDVAQPGGGNTEHTHERSPSKKARPAVPDRPRKTPRTPSTPDEKVDGAVVSMIRGPGPKFDEVTQGAEVLKPLTRERAAAPRGRTGSLSGQGRDRLVSMPAMTDKAEEISTAAGPARRHSSASPDMGSVRQLPVLPSAAPRTTSPPSAAHRTNGHTTTAKGDTSGLPTTSNAHTARRDSPHDVVEPYAVVRTTPDLGSGSGGSSGNSRPSSSSPPMLEGFEYTCHVPSSEEYDNMGVPEIGVHVHKLKDVARSHDKLFFERYHRKAHQADRKAIREVVLSLAAAKRRLEVLKLEQVNQVTATAPDTVASVTSAPIQPPQPRKQESSLSLRGPTPMASPSPDSGINVQAAVSAPPPTLHSVALTDYQGLFRNCPGVAEAVDGAWLSLEERRSAAGRPNDVSQMTARQVVEEKHVIQKILLQYESVFGRPKTAEDRKTMKPIYEFYKSLKKEIERRDSTIENIDGDTSPPPTIQTLGATIMDDVQRAITAGGPQGPQAATPPRERLMSDQIGRRSPSPIASVDKDAMSRSLPIVGAPDRPVVPTDHLASTGGSGPNPPAGRKESVLTIPLSPAWVAEVKKLNRGELRQRFGELSDSKTRLKKRLKIYEDEFFQRNGRRVEKEDRGSMVGEYEEYKHTKAKLRLLETVMERLEAKNSQTC